MNINDLKNKKCFTTPEGYFEQLNLGIKEATCKNSAPSPKKRSLTRRVTRIMGYAAMIAIIATVATNVIFKNTQSNNIENNFVNIEESEFIDNMLASYPIDDYTFYCYLTGCE